MSNGTKSNFLGVLISFVFSLGLFYAFFVSGVSKMFYVGVLSRDVFIPLVGWVILLVYAFLWSALFKENLKAVLGKTIILGLVIHASILLYKLNLQLTAESPFSAIYLYYIKLFTIVTLSCFFAFGFKVLQKGFMNGEIKELFFLPVVYLSFIFIYLYTGLSQVISISSLVLGLILSLLIVSDKSIVWSLAGKIKLFFKNEKRIILAIFLIALLVRLVFSFQMLHQTGGGAVFVSGSDDGDTYDGLAWQIVQDPVKAIRSPEVFPTAYDPGYTVFLAAIYKVFGRNYYAVTAIQSAMNAMIPVLIFLIASMLFSRSVGIIAALFVSLDQAAIMHSVVLGTEAFFPLLLGCAILFFLKFLKNPEKRKYLILVGLFLGLTIVTRYMLILFPLFMFSTILFIPGIRFRGKVASIILISMIIALCILPVTALNYMNTKEIHLVERSGYRMDMIWHLELTPAREERSPGNIMFIKAGFDPMNKPYESFLLIFQKPGELSKIAASVWSRRLRNYFCWSNFGFFDPLIIANPARYPNEYGSAMEFYFFILYMIGLALSVKGIKRDRSILVIFMVLAYFIFIHVILFRVSTPRYRVVAIPYIAIFFALGLKSVYDFIKQKTEHKKIEA